MSLQALTRPAARPLAAASARADLPSHVVCYDIETVPDAEIPAPENESFPKPYRHKVVCISVAVARIDRDPDTGLERYDVEEIRSGGDPAWSERRLLKSFWSMLEARPSKLVGWNTRRFDGPVLHVRSMLYGLDAGIWWRRGDRWTGYDARYSDVWACDVMDALASRGAASPHGLDELAGALGLPGKMGESGGKVAEMFEAGEIVRIRRYCETDVANCLGVYFYFQRLVGRVDEAGFASSLDSLRRCLTRDPEGTPHLAEFARRWPTTGSHRTTSAAPGMPLGKIPVTSSE